MARLSTSLRSFLLAIALISTPALAQDPGVTGELERTASTSPKEKLDYADTTTAELRSAIRDLARMADVARRENEQERLQCLSSRLTSVRALLQVSEAAQASMAAALEAGEMERADHEFRKIAVARTKTRELMSEAQACVTGEEAVASGDAIITVEGGDFPDESELLETPYDPFDLGNDPPEQSPYL